MTHFIVMLLVLAYPNQAEKPEVVPPQDREQVAPTEPLNPVEIERRKDIYTRWVDGLIEATDKISVLPKKRRGPVFNTDLNRSSSAILTQYGLTPNSLETIVRQGFKENWPTPDEEDKYVVAQFLARADARAEILQKMADLAREREAAAKEQREFQMRMFALTAAQQNDFNKLLLEQEFRNRYLDLWQQQIGVYYQGLNRPLIIDRSGPLIPY